LEIRSKIKDWLETKLLFVIRREDDFSVVTSFNVTKAKIVLVVSLLVFVGFASSMILTRTILKRWFDPEFIASDNVAKIVELSAKIDSLTNQQAYEQSYIQSIRKIILGEDEYLPEFSDSIAGKKDGVDKNVSFEYSDATNEMLEEFDNVPLDFVNTNAGVSGKFYEGYFFTPLKGVLLSGYLPQKNQFGVKIKAQENEAVKVIADGVVILSVWTPDNGNIIAVQHSNDLISIYKGSAMILKKFGDFVRAGEIISIFGESREISSENYLLFELWYKMSPLNPEEFIIFN
jgi:murein DD-endopeptidase MepM/ murein hydrolase activator NlpD